LLELIAFLIVGVIGAGAVALLRLRRARLGQHLRAFERRRAAKDLTLSSDLFGLKMTGVIEGHDVRVDEARTAGGATTHFRVDGRGRIPEDIVLRWPEPSRLPLGHPLWEDGDFASRVDAAGDEFLLLSVLTAETRALLKEWDWPAGWKNEAQVTVSVEHGLVDAWVRGDAVHSSLLKWMVRRMVKLAQQLALQPGEVADRLARNATGEDRVRIRVRNLELLQERFRESPITERTSRSALADSSPEMRFQGAAFLGEFDAMAELATLGTAAEDLRLRAIAHLVSKAPAARAVQALEKLLSPWASPVQRAAIEGLGRLRHQAAIPSLAALLNTEDKDTAVEIARALEQIGDPSAEPALLSLLDREDDALKLAAARALRRVGTVSAVEPLLPYARRLLDSDLRRAARETVAQIQARLGDVDAGRLAVVEVSEAEGAVSLAPESGTLALDADEEP